MRSLQVHRDRVSNIEPATDATESDASHRYRSHRNEVRRKAAARCDRAASPERSGRSHRRPKSASSASSSVRRRPRSPSPSPGPAQVPVPVSALDLDLDPDAGWLRSPVFGKLAPPEPTASAPTPEDADFIEDMWGFEDFVSRYCATAELGTELDGPPPFIEPDPEEDRPASTRQERLLRSVASRLTEQCRRNQQFKGSWYRLFKVMDKDGDGHLRFGEIQKAVRDLLKVSARAVSRSDLKLLWRGLDSDGSRAVSVTAFAKFMRTHGPHGAKARPLRASPSRRRGR